MLPPRRCCAASHLTLRPVVFVAVKLRVEKYPAVLVIRTTSGQSSSVYKYLGNFYPCPHVAYY